MEIGLDPYILLYSSHNVWKSLEIFKPAASGLNKSSLTFTPGYLNIYPEPQKENT